MTFQDAFGRQPGTTFGFETLVRTSVPKVWPTSKNVGFPQRKRWTSSELITSITESREPKANMVHGGFYPPESTGTKASQQPTLSSPTLSSPRYWSVCCYAIVNIGQYPRVLSRRKDPTDFARESIIARWHRGRCSQSPALLD